MFHTVVPMTETATLERETKKNTVGGIQDILLACTLTIFVCSSRGGKSLRIVFDISST